MATSSIKRGPSSISLSLDQITIMMISKMMKQAAMSV
eukprot:CAMPEP_0202464276 /NCGR_PEP_ID=MMETSP1360-20130828/61425_1 /ASSEMBLY_ACC=CAM_ASM_000848 /TAXON_ID=515479 /ORGANISM="Licmophora paradoxa, Strain CCMP2313" /LENGTH=36 /DNA_ID= /DNA_START= /DNA_END= /DNA_ORIENTATION=